MIKLPFFSTNKEKIVELGHILQHFDIEVEQINEALIEIQDSNIKNIAVSKLNSIHKSYKMYAVEDSALFIDALNGFPGPYSSYVQSTIGNNGILKLMINEMNRDATFITVIALKINSDTKIFEGVVRGIITEVERGFRKFGYDPVFIPSGYTKTYAEMDANEKSSISHRFLAAEKLGSYIRDHFKDSPEETPYMIQ